MIANLFRLGASALVAYLTFMFSDHFDLAIEYQIINSLTSFVVTLTITIRVTSDTRKQVIRNSYIGGDVVNGDKTSVK